MLNSSDFTKMTADIDEISKVFERWNPMEQAYNDLEFNSFEEGPGVDLNEFRNQNNKDKKMYPYLCVMNIPPLFTTNALHRMCTQYAKVRCVRDSRKCPHYFIEFETIAELEAAYRGLENNTLGLKVAIGRHKAQNQKNWQHDPTIPGIADLPSFNDDTNVEIQKRLVRPAKMPFNEPCFECPPLVTEDDYTKAGSKLNESDPNRQYLIGDDAHALEREKLDVPPKFKDDKEFYIFRRGTKQTEITEDAKRWFESKCRESIGMFYRKDLVYKTPSNDDFLDRFVQGQCKSCGTACDFTCPRCGTFYCGLECQKRDWPVHFNVCLKRTFDEKDLKSNNPLQHLAKTKPLENDINAMEVVMPPQSGSLVVITSVCSSNLVFIRSKASADNEHYFQIISLTHAAGCSLQKLAALPSCGNIVAVNFHGQFKRAMVLNTSDPQAVRVILVDYGNVENEPLENLYELPVELQKAHRYVVPVMLKGVSKRYMTEELRTLMYCYLNDIDMTIKYKMDDVIPAKGTFNVELINGADNVNLNEAILRISTPVDPSKGEVCLMEYLPQQYLRQGNGIELVIMDNSNLRTGVVTCTNKKYALEAQKFSSELQEYAASLPEEKYAPRINELCLVKLEDTNKWYRGACLELVGDGYPSILLVDYGYIIAVNIRHIRRYPPQFTFPIFAHDCEIIGVREFMDDQVEQYLQNELTVGKTILCAEVTESVEDELYKIRLPRLLHVMRSKGLLKNRQELFD